MKWLHLCQLSICWFRMEKHEWRSTSSQAKVLGTIISIAGAFVVTFYKGPTILRLPHQLLSSPQRNWVLGGLLLAVDAFLNSAWYVMQVRILNPCYRLWQQWYWNGEWSCCTVHWLSIICKSCRPWFWKSSRQY